MYGTSPSVLPPLMWSKVVDEISTMAKGWINEPMPINLDSTARGSLRDKLSMANRVLRNWSAHYDVNVEGWSIQAWNPDDFLVTHRITFVAVDPSGIAHDMTELARTPYAVRP